MSREVVRVLRGSGDVGIVALIEQKYLHARNMAELILSGWQTAGADVPTGIAERVSRGDRTASGAHFMRKKPIVGLCDAGSQFDRRVPTEVREPGDIEQLSRSSVRHGP